MPGELIPAEVVSRYEYCMAIVEDKGAISVASTLEMWNAMLEIWSRALWRARFLSQEEWISHVTELGYTGMSRSTIFDKLQRMKFLMNAGVSREIAAALVTAVPGAAREVETVQSMAAAAHGKKPDDYARELMQLSPGEAIKRAQEDKGNRVKMWVSDARQLPNGIVVGVVTRSDSQKGFSAYDLRIEVTPQIPGNRPEAEHVARWVGAKLGGHLDPARNR